MYFLNPRLAADVFDGEYIIANLDTGLYYSIQGMAVSLINALPFQDYDEIVTALVDAFPDHASSIKVELTSIIGELLNEEIIKKDSSGILSSSPVLTLPDTYSPPRFNRYADMQDLLLLDPIHDVDEEGWTVQKEAN